MKKLIFILSCIAVAAVMTSCKDGVAKAFDEIEFTYYIRTSCSKVELSDKLEAVCDKVEIVSENADIIEAVAGKMSYKTLISILPEATAIRILD